jgi:hypothetical protein
MRKITKAAAATLAGAALAVAPLAASQASARPPARLPVVYSQVQGWHGGHVRPAFIGVGQGGAPGVAWLKWRAWTTSSAQGTGTLIIEKPGCRLPSYECAYQRFPVTVALGRVETHAGVRYYSRMTWAYTSNRVRRVLRWATRNGFWDGPAK